MNEIVLAIEAISEAIIKNKDLLTVLDAAIGDGDHGINMARGFAAVQQKIKETNPVDIGVAFKTMGMTLISTVGGASGPLYGTAFMRAATPAIGKKVIDKGTAVLMFSAAINGIRERGKAVRGEKTMLDALEPAYEAFVQGIKEQKALLECLEMACSAAMQGIEFTKTIIATKGRASYLNERSLGHQDAGATSSYIILMALSDFCHNHTRGDR